MHTIEELQKEIEEKETEIWETHRDYGEIINGIAREWQEDLDIKDKQISQQSEEINRLRKELIKQVSRTRLFLDILEPFSNKTNNKE